MRSRGTPTPWTCDLPWGACLASGPRYGVCLARVSSIHSCPARLTVVRSFHQGPLVMSYAGLGCTASICAARSRPARFLRLIAPYARSTAGLIVLALIVAVVIFARLMTVPVLINAGPWAPGLGRAQSDSS